MTGYVLAILAAGVLAVVVAMPPPAPTCFLVGPPGPGHGVSINELPR